MGKLERINEMYTSIYNEEDALDNLIYLTSKNRGERTTESHIRKCYREETLGSLLKRLDPSAYNQLKQEV
jgi:hypothetical protein